MKAALPGLALALAVAMVVGCGDNGGGTIVQDTSDTGGPGETRQVETCATQCEGKECGPDGCGGLCGECVPMLETCSDAGVCESVPCTSSLDCPSSLVCDKEAGICVVCVGDEDCEEGLFCGADHDCHSVHSCESDKDCKDYEMVCDKASGVCVECTETSECPADQYCLESFCVDDACVAGQTWCEGQQVLACNEEGSETTVQATCSETQYCQDAQCHDYTCQPGATFCDGDVYKVCNEEGTEVQYEEDCAAKDQHCFNGACIDTVCVPGADFCVDGVTVAHCSADGMSSESDPCPAEHYCSEDNGNVSCEPWVCEPSSKGCEGTTAWSCNAMGSGHLTEVNCAASGKLCSQGECVACEPECAGKDCGDDGCGGSCGECEEEETCVDGLCKGSSLTCEVGGECPELAGYVVSCNPQGQCEYTNLDSSGWKNWDVWVWVPPGSFPMGSPDGEEYQDTEEETPVHTVTFQEGFFIGKYEVVVEQYEACMAAVPEQCTPPDTSLDEWTGWTANSSDNGRGDHPQNGLTWGAARAFCEWVAPGGRLPSEAEWEYAATGPTHRMYPWGDSPEPNCDLAVFDHVLGADGTPWGCNPCPTIGCSGTSPVGSATAGAAWSGALDMSGNVLEWCEDAVELYYGYEGAPSDGSAWVMLDAPIIRMTRGGKFSSTPSALRTASRTYLKTGLGGYSIGGARCVRN